MSEHHIMSCHDYSWYQQQGHLCGLYYNVPVYGRLQRTYLPQVELQAHATILATTSRTVLTQVFVNPSANKGIREVRYTFPLYDGVSVVGFTCHVGDRVIVGEVKEKEKARAVFKDAMARGETAGLFEQLPEASDVFTTTVGNLPPDARVMIKITYLGELKHDMEVDGIRYIIPNIICPRYGNTSTSLQSSAHASTGISITVDAEMADGSFIQKIQSPTHPISMTIGTTSLAPDADPTMTKASATLALGTTELDKDFVLQIIAKNTGVPKAILENHPSIPNHRALMATLVPKFALPPEKPEIVFVCDRSGSMMGTRITLVVQALKVFLKSLPIGVKFNICSFGSSYSFLWRKSVTYSQSTLDEAIRHAETFEANYGGTEMLEPLKATINERYKDMPLDVMVLTDGETWNQEALFSYLNDSVTKSKAPIRLFTLGIGNGVSHALIEGIAKAGNGFSQSVGEGEKMDTKVVRMLKGALSPHVNDYTLEVKYANTTLDEEDEDFEIIEKVADSLKVKLTMSEEDPKPAAVSLHLSNTRVARTNHEQKKPISLFDTSADPDREDSPVHDDSGEHKYAHLPKIDTPKIIQAPQDITSLFAFNRTTVYLLLGPEAPKATPKSVLLRGTSAHGLLELEIPIQILDQPNETIHQLAAKKAISELEQGRGWLSQAQNDTGKPIKTKFEGRYDDMVEREAVRLGVQFQVGGKWCSFVAVESNKRSKDANADKTEDWEYLDDEKQAGSSTKSSNNSKREVGWGPYKTNPTVTDENLLQRQQGSPSFSFGARESVASSFGHRSGGRGGSPPSVGRGGGAFGSVSGFGGGGGRGGNPFGNPTGGGRGGFAPQSLLMSTSTFPSFDGQMHQQSYGGYAPPSGEIFGGSSRGVTQAQSSVSLFGQSSNLPPPQSSASLFGQSSYPPPPQSSASLFGQSSYPPPPQSSAGLFGAQPSASDAAALRDYQTGLLTLHQGNRNRRMMMPQGQNRLMSEGDDVVMADSAPSDDDVDEEEQEEEESMPTQRHSKRSKKQTSPFPAPLSTQAEKDADYQMQLMLLEQHSKKRILKAQKEQDRTRSGFLTDSGDKEPKREMSDAPAESAARFGSAQRPPKSFAKKRTPEELTHFLISLQSFEGSWQFSQAVVETLGIEEEALRRVSAACGADLDVFITAAMVAVFEQKLKAFEGSWELVVGKARDWLAEQGVGDADELVEKAKVLVK
jgi:hypothetical protein